MGVLEKHRKHFPFENSGISHISRIIVLFISLAVGAFALACDDNNNSGPNPTPTPTLGPTPTPTPVPTPPPDCIHLEDQPDALLDFEDCPTEGLIEFCTGYGCNFYEGEIFVSPLALQGFVTFSDCEVIDCFNIECDFLGTGIEPRPFGILTIEEILGNSNLAGISSLDVGEFSYECSPIIAN